MKAKLTLIVFLLVVIVMGIVSPIYAAAGVQRRHTVYRRQTVYVRHRPMKHQVAIVGGSAAGGALIGALAGGGKGALIGGAIGAGGGAIYNQATKNKKVVQ
jgi:outer membrane lipoprotein SlyB